ncbi:MAG: hypothetical protein IJX81_03720 [Clostridia bacterium]|nr:hypothetical protein [Clostridia bacterium]
MDISKIDENFKTTSVTRDDVVWYDAETLPLYGVFYDKERECFARMPHAVAKTVSLGVEYLAENTSGGRVRFMTDSPFVAIKCLQTQSDITHNSSSGMLFAFSVYQNGEYRGMVSPTAAQRHDLKEGCFFFDGLRPLAEAGEKEVALFFPLYNKVKKAYIGLKAGCKLLPPKVYTYSKPVVFYGSSITQGGCASHSGNDYISVLSRWLDFDYVNLGFSGGARGEKEMREYLASLDASVFVLDYDHNAPNVAHLQNTHYPLYEGIRKAHPQTPILFLSKPDMDFDPEASEERKRVIRATYLQAKKEGDENVFFIDGKKLFGKEDRTACTVDGCHPNDLGFYRMAKTVKPVLEKILKKLAVRS